MKLKRMRYIPLLLGCFLTGCSCVVVMRKPNTEITVGPTKGKFAIRMDNEETSLKMDVHSTFDSYSDFIDDTDIPNFTGAFAYKWVSKKVSDIHSEYTDSLMGKDGEGIQFYKYTFFIKNTGDSDASYYMDINLLDIAKDDVCEYLRVMVFEGQNKQTVFAKPSKTNSNNDGKELLDCYDESLGAAEILNNQDITIGPNTLDANESIKFTLLFWLEGSDPECKSVPDDFFLNVEVYIKGYK